MISRKPMGFIYKDKTIFEQMLFNNTVRGFDSTGVFGINKYGNVVAHKTATAAPDAMKTTTFQDFFKDIFSQYKIVVGHNRASTRGATVDENAHPFIEDDICLVHNGTLHSHKQLADVVVDSHAICHSLNKQGYEKTFKNLDGAFALIWYDAKTKKLHMARNKERPLYMVVTGETYYFASELKMLDWILSRNDVKDYKSYYLEEDKTYTWNLDNPKEFTIKDTPKKTWQPTKYAVTTYSNFYPKNKETPTKPSYPTSLINDDVIDVDDDEDIEYPIGSVIEFYNNGAAESRRKRMNLIGYTTDGANTTVTCQIPQGLAPLALESLLDAEYIQATVSMVYNKKGKQSLFLRDPIILDNTITTKKGITITRDQLEKHGEQCDNCSQTLSFDFPADLEHSIIEMNGDDIKKITCPDCIADFTKWGIINQHTGYFYDDY